MKQPKNIEYTIAKIVTGIAMAFPVAYIRSISFFMGNTKVAFCSWETLQKQPLFQLLETGSLKFPEGAYQSVIVDAVDLEGNVVTLNSSIASAFYSIN